VIAASGLIHLRRAPELAATDDQGFVERVNAWGDEQMLADAQRGVDACSGVASGSGERAIIAWICWPSIVVTTCSAAFRRRSCADQSKPSAQ